LSGIQYSKWCLALSVAASYKS